MPGCSVERMNWKRIARRELGHGERITVIWSIIYRGQFTNDLGGIRGRPPKGLSVQVSLSIRLQGCAICASDDRP